MAKTRQDSTIANRMAASLIHVMKLKAENLLKWNALTRLFLHNSSIE